jgi:hypothetical protein
MIHKNATSKKSRRPRKMPKRRKSVSAKKPAPSRKKPVQNPGLAGVRPPPPGRDKRDEKGSLAYLLRRAQAATRLTLERALADLGVTPPQFAVLTMLGAYPGLSGADLASRHGAGAAATDRTRRQDPTRDPALAVQNCRRSAAGWLVPALQLCRGPFLAARLPR